MGNIDLGIYPFEIYTEMSPQIAQVPPKLPPRLAAVFERHWTQAASNYTSKLGEIWPKNRPVFEPVRALIRACFDAQLVNAIY
jgi:hypothetical protein